MKIVNQFLSIAAVVILISLSGCKSKDSNPAPVTPPITTTTTFFAKGADVSWVTQMESQNITFSDANGTPTECMTLLKSKGMNAIRLRAWVNPTDGWCNTKDVVIKAKRAAALGMKILIDFHYSDSWADPSKQPIPAAWTGLSLFDMQTALYNYTVGVMDTLVKVNGLTIDWVQVGNETNDGMDWETGRASTSMAGYVALVYSGFTAVKFVSPNTKVIIHLANGQNGAPFHYIFDGLKAAGVNWDIIGMSLYPTSSEWASYNTQCLANMTDMIATYSKPVMICEVGMSWDDPTDSKAFLTDILAKTKSIPNNMGLGVFYWEPECYNNWSGYTLGAFDNSGKPTAALDAFAD